MRIDGACHSSRVMIFHCTDCQVLSGAPLRAVVAPPIGSFVWQHSAVAWLSKLQSIPGSPDQRSFLPAPP